MYIDENLKMCNFVLADLGDPSMSLELKPVELGEKKEERGRCNKRVMMLRLKSALGRKTGRVTKLRLRNGMGRWNRTKSSALLKNLDVNKKTFNQHE